MTRASFRVEPRDVPAAIAARRMGMTEAEFGEVLPNLIAKAFLNLIRIPSILTL
jgi:hypothetical protein